MYYLHRVESHQNNTNYYKDEKIKEIKREIVGIKSRNLAVQKLKLDIKNQIGMKIPNKEEHSNFYYIADFKIFSINCLKQFVQELKRLKPDIKSEILIDIFDMLIDNYSDEEWLKL